ncbi:hypothetical protein CVV65_11130 [Kyrpidia spormannii]|uniref:Glycosyltransferase RgtA/B/C/D-like domain-containing protein n=1 Tax=Kyrpidia spormannii TaxID=2055160 RepID=A0A2K8N7T7_9BACL|nr:glycosyltransferase family 39 protein [Kyrpidia spormannii]ATY85409.1 hypothetical protein CVV65_11130 [Kyrpidia spormannii]
MIRWPRWIGWVILLAFVLRIAALMTYGLSLTLHSDDQGYVHSAIRLLQTGTLTYRGPSEPARFELDPTVKIMPGQPFLLAAIFWLFGTGTVGVYAAKIATILIGLAGIYGIYLLGRYCFGEAAGLIAALLLAVSVEQILTDNLLLTETPFMTSLIYLVYFSVKLASKRKPVYFYALLFFYLVALFFKATVALYPLVLFVYLLFKRYPFPLMIRQATIALVAILVVLGPWWVRNYVHYHQFIPLTAGDGNPLLMGTYQGVGYPNHEPLSALLQRLQTEYPNADSFTWMQVQKEVAMERLREWWQSSPGSLLYSYLLRKPIILWGGTFYWIEIFRISPETVVVLHHLAVVGGVAGGLLYLALNRHNRGEMLFIAMVLGYFTVVYSVYFVFGRYNVAAMPLVFLGIGAGTVAVRRCVRIWGHPSQ